MSFFFDCVYSGIREEINRRYPKQYRVRRYVIAITRKIRRMGVKGINKFGIVSFIRFRKQIIFLEDRILESQYAPVALGRQFFSDPQ